MCGSAVVGEEGVEECTEDTALGVPVLQMMVEEM